MYLITLLAMYLLVFSLVVLIVLYLRNSTFIRYQLSIPPKFNLSRSRGHGPGCLNTYIKNIFLKKEIIKRYRNKFHYSELKSALCFILNNELFLLYKAKEISVLLRSEKLSHEMSSKLYKKTTEIYNKFLEDNEKLNRILGDVINNEVDKIQSELDSINFNVQKDSSVEINEKINVNLGIEFSEKLTINKTELTLAIIASIISIIAGVIQILSMAG